MSGQLPIYNIQVYDQKKLLALPSVIVRRVESISIPRNIFAGVTGVTGGRNIEMEKKMNDMMVGLIDDLKKEALRVNNKVVALLGLDIQYSEMGQSSGNMLLSAQAIATPIIRRPVTQNTRPALPVESVASESVAPVAPAMPQMPPVAPAMPPVQPVAPVAPGPSMPPFGSQLGNQISQMRGGSNKTRGRRIRKRSYK
jgi:uncharacterized protein YbjQ (UPF0145 family)